MDNSLIEQGFNLMLFGMGTVFVFLTLLIFATTLMSKIVLRWFPEKATPAPVSRKPVSTAAIGSGNTPVAPATLKVLQAAIDKHRKR